MPPLAADRDCGSRDRALQQQQPTAMAVAIKALDVAVMRRRAAHPATPLSLLVLPPYARPAAAQLAKPSSRQF